MKTIFSLYLKKTNLKSRIDLVDIYNCQTFFKQVTLDFINMKLRTDSYSMILEELGTILSKNQDTRDLEITRIANLGGELNWYLRNDPIRAGEFLNQIFGFYKMLPNTDHE